MLRLGEPGAVRATRDGAGRSKVLWIESSAFVVAKETEPEVPGDKADGRSAVQIKKPVV